MFAALMIFRTFFDFFDRVDPMELTILYLPNVHFQCGSRFLCIVNVPRCIYFWFYGVPTVKKFQKIISAANMRQLPHLLSLWEKHHVKLGVFERQGSVLNGRKCL